MEVETALQTLPLRPLLLAFTMLIEGGRSGDKGGCLGPLATLAA